MDWTPFYVTFAVLVLALWVVPAGIELGGCVGRSLGRITLCPHTASIREYTDGRMRVRCLDCLRVTEGWTITTTPRERS
jgi:hypothetical protein